MIRDSLLLFAVLALCGLALRRPFYGVLLITWLGHMSPQTFTWGFSKSLPFVAMAVLATGIGLLLSKDRSTPPNSPPMWLLGLFIFWVSLSTIFALYPEYTSEYSRFIKIQVTVLLILFLIKTKDELIALVATIAFSIGFFGIKGGLFTLASGGSYRVWGPDGTFIGGNNEIALALLMVAPLFYFLITHFDNKWGKRFLAISIVLCVVSVVGSQSRGAFLAMTTTLLFFWTKSSNKLAIAVISMGLIIIGSFFIPDAWFARMDTIQSYEQDGSAMGRINSWYTGFNVAANHFFGGGFGAYTSRTFLIYAPNPTDVHDAHSIYFEILGEQGFGGLLLFLAMFISTWFMNNKTIRLAGSREALRWAKNLAKMLNVSLIAYASGGAFLGLAYWDLPYQLVAITVILYRITQESLPSSQGKGIFIKQATAQP